MKNSFKNFKNISHSWIILRVSFLALLLASCGKSNIENQDEISARISKLSANERERLCPKIISTNSFFERTYSGQKTGGRMSFQEIRNSVNSACMNCHQAPSQNGGFTYEDSYESIKKNADKFAVALLTDDLAKRMPPDSRRKKNPDAFLQIGRNVKSWIDAGSPEGEFDLNPGQNSGSINLTPGGELGECMPTPEIKGFDYKKDLWFSTLKKLPNTLAETDLVTLDSLELAARGTFSYNVEYPLWTDNSSKGRYIHVPYKIINNKLTLQTIQYNPSDKKFTIPENTRFYKTFYKIIKQKDGKMRAKRVETRIIVVRNPGTESLFGTYAWDESEQVATLVQTPYRDGTPFKDTVFKIVTDETKGTTRTYGIPGRHRCFECHMGSENKSLVLGFSPLQINRRNIGEAGRVEPLNNAEATQVKRMLDYGVISGVQHTDQLPKLEWFGRERPRNNLELKANGYFVGNCAHCHNPNGFAFTKENGITLNLSAGETFGFNTFTKSVQIPTRAIVHHEGNLDLSHLYRKVADPPEAQGMTSQMPMHTAGAPDCNVLKVVGQWVKSFGDYNEALNWVPDCKPAKDVKWIDQDFTWPTSDQYIPRRDDWKDPVNGMPEEPFKNLRLTSELREVINKEFAVGYWNKKDSCKFPNVNLPEKDQRPWMVNRGIPKRPFGEIYSTTPGSWFFRTSCMKCHGQEADGNTALARGILNWSGGSVRVANLKDGMFGNKSENLKTFDLEENGKKINLGGNYLIWMAMKGTRVKFPDELSSIIGKHGGQMLNQIKDKCLRQISPDKTSSPNYSDHEIFNKVCFQNNRYPGDPELAFDPYTAKPKNPEIVEEWLDRAAYNGGWAIYQYLKDTSEGRVRVGNDECEKVFNASSLVLRNKRRK
jgi:hypothetical protein